MNLGTPKSIDTPFLRVSGNCLEIENTTIQLSNISLFSTADIDPAKFPVLSIFLILIGLLSLERLPLFTLITITLGGLWIYHWYSSAEKTKQLKRLTIITNSGNMFPIVFDDKVFLTKVVRIMTDIIRDPVHTRDITINVKECTFSDEASVISDMHDQ